MLELRYDQNGRPVDPAAVRALLAACAEPSCTDLLVLAHGWNSADHTTRALYGRLVDGVGQLGGRFTAMHRPGLVVAGVLWPSMQFGNDPVADPRAQLAGLGAQLGTGAGAA